jgi:hypothetical protein
MIGILLMAVVAAGAAAQTKPFEFYPGATYDPAIPTLQQVVGHSWGEQVSSHAQIEKYLEALAKAAPTRTRLVKHGESWEGRAIYHLIIGSAANMARLEEIKKGLQRLADPRTLSEAEAQRLIDTLPPVTWLAYGVHGNEISSPDAALLTAYHLLASQNDPVVKEILERTLVILDPTQNPDGRDRFVNYYRQTRGREPDAQALAAEHNEVWPGGRSNHYLFDMNRDWFAATQPETRGRLAAFLEWYPVVFVDLHEMGGNSTYYFAPPAQPYNPNLTPRQVELLNLYGKNNSEWFDKFRFDYFTRDVFDSFYPGYGEGWPMFHGSIGMTYEQASTRGLILARDDETMMHYRDTVHHHFIASISTAQTTARNAREMLRHFYDYRRSAIQEGQTETVKEYILPPGRDPNRATKLAALLMRQGIEVKRADRPFTNPRVRDYYEDKVQAKEFPAGTYVISLAQPAKRLVKTLLDKHTPISKEFLDEQIRLRKKRLPDEFYDVTAWSLPLLYDVEMYAAEQASTASLTTLKEMPRPQGRLVGGRAHLAYLIPWNANSAASAAADLLRQGVRLYRASRGFTLNDVKFPGGTLIVKVKDNPEDLHARIERVVAEHGAVVYATDRGWVEEGDNLGSNYVRYVQPPRIAMAWNEPASSLSAGWTRYVLEQMYGVPVTVIRTAQLRNADLRRFNVLILPSGSYTDVLGEAGIRNLRGWVEQGGTLIAVGGATRWLTEERVNLLATTRELRGGKPEREERPAQAGTPAQAAPAGQQAAPRPAEQKPTDIKTEADLEKAIQPDRELPDDTPGAIFRVRVDNEHWLGLGYGEMTNVLVDSNNIYVPLKLDRGTNVATYLGEDKALVSGFTWEATRKQMPNKAYLMHQPMGRGQVVAFAEDPNYRAFLDGLNLMFLNAALFGPSHRRGPGFGE